MAIEKINFSYPKGSLQSVFDTEALTALELASKTSKKVDECIEVVNGVEQIAINATTIVDDMRLQQDQFLTDNADTRQQLIADNQLYLDGLTTSKTAFETDLNASKTAFESDLNASKTAFEADLNASKTAFEADMTTAVNNVVANADATVNTAVGNKVDALIADGTIETLLNENILNDVKTDIQDIAYNIKSKFGAVGDGVTDDTQAFLDMATFVNGRNYTKIYIPSGVYKINQQITINKNVSIVGDNEKTSILDFSTATGTFLDNTGILITGNAITALPAPTTDLTKNSTVITFSNAHNLVVGDIITILDTTLFSWSDYRDTYRKGEMCKIINVNGLIVTLDRPLYDNYTNDANLSLNKLSTINANIEKIGFNLKPTETTGTAGVLIRYGKDCKITEVNAKGSNWTHVNIENCFNTIISKINIDYNSIPIGLNYGVSISNCNKVLVTECNLKTGRHGLMIGGQDYITSIINREIDITDCTIASYTAIGGDMHGNVEYVRYKNCNLENGVTIAGNNTEVTNCNINEELQGIAVYFAEVKGMSHLIKDNVITVNRYTQASGNGNGIIRGQLGVNLKEGGNLIIKNNKITDNVKGTAIGLLNSSNVDFNVIIEDNNIKRMNAESDTRRGIAFAGHFDVVKITNNYVERGDIYFTIFEHNLLQIKNNLILNSCGNGISYTILSTTARTPIIEVENNTLIKSGTGGATFSGKDNLIGELSIINNTVLDSNELLNVSTNVDISFYINNFKSVTMKNNVIGDKRTVMKQKRLYYANNITDFMEENNKNVGGVLATVITNIVNNINGFLFNQDTNKRIISYALAIPTTGTWTKGSIIYNTSPTAGGFIGWICVTAGSPGTWKGFGTIEV